MYLKSFFDRNEEKEKARREKEDKDKKPSFDLNPEIISKRDLRAILLGNIVDFDGNWIADKNVYNKYLVGDLDVYFGKNADPKFNLISKINRTKTVVGELTLATMIARPTANIQELLRRQQAIKTLIEYKKQDDTIDKILDTYKNIENNITSLFHERDPFYNPTIYNNISELFLFKDNSRNTVKFLGHRKMIVRDLGGIFFKATYPEFLFLPFGLGIESSRKIDWFLSFPIVGSLPLLNSDQSDLVSIGITFALGFGVESLF